MTLLMRDQENLEKGIKRGKVYGTISAYRELSLPEDVILNKLMKRFQLTEKEAKEYLEQAE